MTRRLSITLEQADEDAVEPFRRDSPERAALISMSAASLTSDAAIVRALIRLGAQAARERALADGYAELAADLAEHDGERRELRRRRVERDRGRA